MKTRQNLLLALGVLTMLSFAGLANISEAAELRGTVSSVEASGQVRIDLPGGAIAKPGDTVRIETVVPGIGPVEIKNRWRVKQAGEGFVIAEPVGQVGGTPQAGYTGIVTTAASTPAATSAPAASTPAVSSAPASSTPVASSADAKALSIPPLKLTGEQLAALKKRAEDGETQAMSLLGMYHGGKADSSDNVPRSLDEAVRWYEKAAQTGDAVAMTSLGFLYQTKRKDDTKAVQWFRKAAGKGNATAMSVLSRSHARGSGVPKDATKSFEWAKKAAQKGDDFAVYELAEMYFTGNGTRQDFVEAAHWYRKAADKGFPPAMTKLARMYTNGMGLAQDLNRGFDWAQKAAQAGSPMAMYQVGTFYLQGIGVAKSPAEAKRWYERAANAGEAEGMFGLSYVYEKGLGVAANPGMAADWMILAIRSHSFQAAASVMRTPWKWSAAFRKEFQKRLLEAGVYSGRIDGDIGSGSRRAIAALTTSG